MSAIKGFPTQKKGLKPSEEALAIKTDASQVKELYATVQDIGSDRSALDIMAKTVFEVSTATLDAASDDRVLVFGAAHNARKGDAIRFTSGALNAVEVGVLEVLDATSLLLATKLDSSASGLDVALMRHTTLTSSSSGGLVIDTGPNEFVEDGVDTQVEIDTVTPANNKGLPSANMYVRDGVETKVLLDTATPANSRPFPVEILSTSGTPATFNITTGEIAIHITHDGDNTTTYDSTRIGDGTNEMAVNASLQAEVHDADALVELQTLSAGLNVVDQLDNILETAITIPASASLPIEVVNSTAAAVKKLVSVDDVGEFVGLYTGAAAAEVLLCVLPIAGGEIEVNIPAATRISLRNMKNATINLSGTGSAMAINFLG